MAAVNTTKKNYTFIGRISQLDLGAMKENFAYYHIRLSLIEIWHCALTALSVSI